ncbi:Mitochondrial distribution and morphology protein 12 [Rhizopus azygosporus]|uniref:Mitochondrial distribution and morphology protein 12 n=1 Tax=Rhizopus azygosporus TaxID=86630 RepID=A0A367K3J8_RHIAZ|nr:Mitochondrial distribution and morphology protein 12 [Rhizopus azygosporus]CEI91609.1 hypothetical protein RMCBS344292_05892 [Rhizopus microsporus]
MSVDLDWQKLDKELAEYVKEFLNKHFQTITKPSFIGDIQVTAFDWGHDAPQIEIVNITDPFPEFYEQEEQEQELIASSPTIEQSQPSPSTDYFSNYQPPRLIHTPLLHQQRLHLFHRSPLVAPQHPFNINNNYLMTHASPEPTTSSSWPSRPSSLLDEDWIDDEEINHVPDTSIHTNNNSAGNTKSTEMDFQVHVLISYKGDMSMTLMTELRMNYPSVMFMSLPIQLCVRSIEFEATAVVAYIQSMKRVCVSMLEEEEHSGRGKDGIESLLRDVHIESVVGDEQKQVLKNVGKIEKFIVDQLRKMLDDELVFPSYQLIELN